MTPTVAGGGRGEAAPGDWDGETERERRKGSSGERHRSTPECSAGRLGSWKVRGEIEKDVEYARVRDLSGGERKT